jgi:hypothetical protein
MKKHGAMLLIAWIGFSGCEMPRIETSQEESAPIVFIRDFKKVQYKTGESLSLSPNAAYAILVPAADPTSCELLDAEHLSLKSSDLVDCVLYLTPSHWMSTENARIRIQVDKAVHEILIVPTL